MDKALNQLVQRVGILDACRRPLDAYFCPECGSRLNLRCGDERRCFAHQVWVEPSCPLRVNEEAGSYGLPTLSVSHDVRVIGWALVKAFCKHLGFPLVTDDDPLVGSNDVTHAQLVTVHLAHEEWDPSRFPSRQADAANVLSRLVSADLAGALRRVLASRLKKLGNTDFEAVPALLREAACAIRWREYFSAQRHGEFLPSPWTERDEPVSLVYFPQQGRFGTRGGEIYHDLRYGASAALEATGVRAHPLRIARLWRDANSKLRHEVTSSNAAPRDRIAVPYGDTLIIYRDPAAPACLYVAPASPRSEVQPVPPEVRTNQPPEPEPAPQSPTAPSVEARNTICERCGCSLHVKNVEGHAQRCVARPEALTRRAAERQARAEAREAGKDAAAEWARAKAEAQAAAEARAQAAAAAAEATVAVAMAEAQARDAANAYAATGAETLEMVHILGGSFWMGSGPDDARTSPDERPRHEVALAPYWISKVPVTQKLYVEVTGKRSGYKVDDRAPVTLVSWSRAVHFCNLLSKHHGLTQVYREDAGVWLVQPEANGYRLPTEAEWEYAARGEDGRTYPWGNTPPTPDLCWGVIGSARWKGPYPVGGHPAGASAFGLLDMVGNVRELVADGYAPYPDASVANSEGPDARTCGPSRVLRGIGLRVASRAQVPMDGRADNIGFRVARGNFPPFVHIRQDPAAGTPSDIQAPHARSTKPARTSAPPPMRQPAARPALPNDRRPLRREVDYRKPPAPQPSPPSPLKGNERVGQSHGTCYYCPQDVAVGRRELEWHLWHVHGLFVDSNGRIVSRRQ